MKQEACVDWDLVLWMVSTPMILNASPANSEICNERNLTSIKINRSGFDDTFLLVENKFKNRFIAEKRTQLIRSVRWAPLVTAPSWNIYLTTLQSCFWLKHSLLQPEIKEMCIVHCAVLLQAYSTICLLETTIFNITLLIYL